MTLQKRRSGSGSVYQRKGGLWVAQVSKVDPLTGKQRKSLKYAQSRDKARELLKDLQVPDLVKPRNSRVTTVQEFAEQWSKVSLPLTNLAPATIALYRNRVQKSIIPLLGACRIGDVDVQTIEAFRLNLAEAKTSTGKPLSQSTQRSDYAALTKMLDSAIDHGLLTSNPCRSVARPSRRPNQRGNTGIDPVPAKSHTPDQVELILKEAQGEQLEPLIRFVADTGCRIGEALELSWQDIDLANAHVRIRKSKTRAGVRVVPLLPEVVASLKLWKAQQRELQVKLGPGWGNLDADLVFTTRTGTLRDTHNARRDLRVILNRINKTLPESEQISTARPWHTFRHSLASRLLNRGVPMPIVSKILGHANIATTVDIYGHAEPPLTAQLMAEAMGRH